MIKTLTLRNFRKHRDLTINLTGGLNALRGSNESGKSTVLEGVLYALYGAKALRNSLAETVTWGHKEHELSVRLVITVDGTDYCFTRSKGGAECNWPVANKVVGHNEVSAFSAHLLGADAKTAAALMMASQSGLRGALDDGPTAVSSLMGKLADFDLIDRIVEQAQAKLLLGAEAPVRGKIEAAETEIEMANEALPDDEIVPTFDKLIARREADQASAEAVLRDELEPEMKALLGAYSGARFTADKRAKLVEEFDQGMQRIANLEGLIAEDERVVATRPTPEQFEKVQAALKVAQDYTRTLLAYTRVSNLPAYPETYWEGDKQSFVDHVQKLRVDEAQLSGGLRAADQAIKELRASLITSGKCPTCGQETMDHDHIETHNRDVEATIRNWQESKKTTAETLAGVQEELAALVQVLDLARPFDEVLAKVANRDVPVTIDTSVYPPRIDWTGDPVSVDGMDQGDLEQQLKQLQKQEREATQAEGSIAVRRDAVAEVKQKLDELGVHIEMLPIIDLAPFEANYNAACAAHSAQQGAIESIKVELAQLREERAEAERIRREAWARLELARSRLREYEADLKSLTFNNALLKKVKALKPAITDYLWNSVLAAVSNFFSQMRGEQSVVSKDGDGFKVNGQSVDSLSGSTLDVLALAIRVALTRTFIPNTGFITLDEPAYGCDTTRTGSVLGFLAAAGFHQTLLASHDELSEAVADNVILLGD